MRPPGWDTDLGSRQYCHANIPFFALPNGHTSDYCLGSTLSELYVEIRKRKEFFLYIFVVAITGATDLEFIFKDATVKGRCEFIHTKCPSRSSSCGIRAGAFGGRFVAFAVIVIVGRPVSIYSRWECVPSSRAGIQQLPLRRFSRSPPESSVLDRLELVNSIAELKIATVHEMMELLANADRRYAVAA